jgi:peptide deformylase
MAILKIARMGHPVLRRRAAPVEDPTDPEIRRLVADMLETMEDAEGTGLAAPQVHVPRRVVVFYVAAERAARAETGAAGVEAAAADDGLAVPLTVLINPVVEPLTGETALGWEACLSVPDLAGQVPRYTAVRYRGLGLDGREILREARGFHARVVQHECDHLDGVLYPQRMTDLSTLTFTSELRAPTTTDGRPDEGTEEAVTSAAGEPT